MKAAPSPLRSALSFPRFCENLQCWNTLMHFNSSLMYSSLTHQYSSTFQRKGLGMALIWLLHALSLVNLQKALRSQLKSFDQHQNTLGMLANHMSGNRPPPSIQPRLYAAPSEIASAAFCRICFGSFFFFFAFCFLATDNI